MLLSTIKINPNNPRIIKDENFQKLKQSIKDDSFLMVGQPIIIDENMVILAGNMRYRALIELGYTEIPDDWCYQATGLTDVQKRAVIIKTNMNYGEWDWDILANDWTAEELDDWGIDLAQKDLWKDEENEAKEKKNGELKCPNCGHVFGRKDNLQT